MAVEPNNLIMNKSLHTTIAALSLLAAYPVAAQTVVKQTTTSVQPIEAVGTVTEFAPDAVIIRTQESAPPVRYTFTKTTEYVDEAGNPVTIDVVKSGAPVTVRYVREGDRLIASRVIVRKAAATTTTTTTAPAVPVAPPTVIKKTTTTTTSKEKDKD
jgi:hypothetical protein